MHTLVAVALVAGAALVGPAPTAHASAPGPRTPAVRVAQEPKEGKGRNEPHPEIHRAMRQLEAAKASLNKANTDFGGHRVAAIKSIDEALEHLRQALNYDKK